MTRTNLARYRDARQGIRSQIKVYDDLMKPIFSSAGLTNYEGNMLLELGHHDGMSVAELSRSVDTGTRGLQHTCNLLHHKQLVRWGSHLIDRRRRLLFLTEKGERLLQRMEGMLAAALEADDESLLKAKQDLRDATRAGVSAGVELFAR